VRLAVVTDIHGNLPALEAVVEDFTRRGVDAVINLGDALSGPLLPRETAQYLMASGWTHLAGNHERQILHPAKHGRGPSDAYAHAQLGEAELAWIATLSPTHRYSDAVYCCHASPRSDLEYFLETVDPHGMRAATRDEIDLRLGGVDAELVLCGHTHVPRVVRASNGTLVVNPGSVGQPGFLDDLPFPHFVSAGSPDARYAIVEQRGAAWTAMLLAVPYDHDAMVALARARDRAEWVSALATGYVHP